MIDFDEDWRAPGWWSSFAPLCHADFEALEACLGRSIDGELRTYFSDEIGRYLRETATYRFPQADYRQFLEDVRRDPGRALSRSDLNVGAAAARADLENFAEWNRVDIDTNVGGAFVADALATGSVGSCYLSDIKQQRLPLHYFIFAVTFIGEQSGARLILPQPALLPTRDDGPNLQLEPSLLHFALASIRVATTKGLQVVDQAPEGMRVNLLKSLNDDRALSSFTIRRHLATVLKNIKN